LPHLCGNELEEIALEAAGDAAISLLARLDDFRGRSRFTTCAYKFALLEAAVKLRRRAWQGREAPLEPETWSLFPSTGLEPAEEAEQSELFHAVPSGFFVLSPRSGEREQLMTRAVRLARNETFFREANELIQRESSSWGEQEFFCECSARGCVNRVLLARPEYEHLRAEGDQFFVAPGHENAEIERVVERFPDYPIVAKVGVAGEYADLTDPRE
jgi:hypothetical protein